MSEYLLCVCTRCGEQEIYKHDGGTQDISDKDSREIFRSKGWTVAVEVDGRYPRGSANICPECNNKKELRA